MNRAFLSLVLLIAGSSVNAAIEKRANPCESGLCLHWWPKLPSIPYWHQELGASDDNGINIAVPDGYDFANAEVVIYARAIFKPRTPETKSLASLISDDETDTRARSPDTKIIESAVVATADGQQLQSRSFVPVASGNWERVAYGEEGDFYLIFTMSARSQAAYNKALSIYERCISQYREK